MSAGRGGEECPCCHYPTLSTRGAFEICLICFWEDDGQDDADADIVRGGPNGTYSLTRARENFSLYQTMYTPGKASPDSDAVQAARLELMRVFAEHDAPAIELAERALRRARTGT